MFNLVFTVFLKESELSKLFLVSIKSKGNRASLACHETGSLVVQVQTACSSDSFFTLRPKSRMESSVNQGFAVFSEVARPRASGILYCIHYSEFISESYLYDSPYCFIVKFWSEKHSRMTSIDHLLDGLLEFRVATNEQGAKPLTTGKALNEGGLDALDKVMRRIGQKVIQSTNPESTSACRAKNASMAGPVSNNKEY